MKIESLKQLIEYAVKCCLDNEIIEDIEFDDSFEVKLTVCGDSWSEYVDYRSANYVIHLQNEINKILKEYVADGSKEYNFYKKQAIVKVKVKQGSQILDVDVIESIKLILNAMTNTQIFTLCAISIAGAVGYFSYTKWLQHRETILTKTEDEKTKRELISLFSGLNKKFDNLEKPVRALIQGMEEDDKITFPGSTEPLKFYDAKRLYPRKPRTRRIEGPIDSNFLITDLKLETPVHVTLERGGVSFKALVDLPEEMVENFYHILEEKHKNEEMPFSLDLQVHATLTERKVHAAIIEGIGQPREGAHEITDIIKIN